MYRVGYVFCDPVLACISVVPLLLLNRLPGVVDDLVCLGSTSLLYNDTIACMQNTTVLSTYQLSITGSWTEQRAALFYEKVRKCFRLPWLLSFIYIVKWVVRGYLVVSVLYCQPRGSGFKSRPGQNFLSEISDPSLHPSLLSYDEYTDRTLPVGRWGGEGEDWPSALIGRG